ncbi:MAG: MoxR family ATPase [Alphaproteobacteria bacterium]|nr:MoxR family ATPase [Pseudomonadota bacterium]MDA1059473.1 MoxR family ATPase [Pseudomonadota bacterium]NQV79929.1 MoxR family ATPase [Alphaproteobacteria bacterium]
MDLDAIKKTADAIRAEVAKAVIGQTDAVDLMLVSLMCSGHILLEGVPGTAKTLMARAFAASLALKFGRIQFTPDLMPGDVLGTNLFNFQSNEFKLTKGPIFTELLLADEINRTPPKTQAALLQAMQERNVTIDGQTYALGGGFMVIATQNPIEQQGTYPLPEAQLDRFLFKHVFDYPSEDDEIAIVTLHGNRTTMPSPDSLGLAAVTNLQTLSAIRTYISDIRLADDVVRYIVSLVRATREHAAIEFGASPRAANMLAAAARAFAALDGRDYVIPDDVKALAGPALRHRIVLSPGAEIDGQTADVIVDQILEQVPAPR